MDYFIFYIPGSMGSLLSVLIRSQIDKNFKFVGFNDNTAHNHSLNIFNNTQNYSAYLDFKKSNKTIEQHLKENRKSSTLKTIGVQRCDINWCEEFINYNTAEIFPIICYINDNQMKLNNLYYKLKNEVLKNSRIINSKFHIKKEHKDYEKILFAEKITWLINYEKKYLNNFFSIDMLPIIQKKNYAKLEKVCKIIDKKILDLIIDDYNLKQGDKKDVFSDFFKFIEKYKGNKLINNSK